MEKSGDLLSFLLMSLYLSSFFDPRVVQSTNIYANANGPRDAASREVDYRPYPAARKMYITRQQAPVDIEKHVAITDRELSAIST